MVRHQKGKKDEPSEPDHPPRRVHYEGTEKSIVFAKLANRKEPAKDFYDDLDEGDKDKFDNLFALIGDFGKISNPEKYRPKIGEINCALEGKVATYPVAEFKIHSGCGKRILAVFDKDQIVLTHGFLKRKELSVEVEKTGRIFCEDISRLN